MLAALIAVALTAGNFAADRASAAPLMLLAADSSASKRPVTEAPPANPRPSKVAIATETDAAAVNPAAAPALDPAADSGTSEPSASQIDNAFISARRAMLKNDLDAYDRSVASIPTDHLLHEYVDYWRLRILLSEKRPESLLGFADSAVRAHLARYPDTIASDLLRRDWMLALGRRGDWSTFDGVHAQWQLRDESAPDCYAQLSVLSRVAPGQKLPAAAAASARELVMRPAALNSACARLFETLVTTGQLAPAELRQRLLLALEANAADDIRQAVSLMSTTLDQKELGLALSSPARLLKLSPTRDGALVALTRLARGDPAAAAELMPLNGAALTPADRRFVWSQIAASGMKRLLPEASGWAREAVGANVSDDSRVWLARAALREQNWPLVEKTILALTPAERGEATWVYWLARARLAQGRPLEATPMFESLAGRLDFYGKLANEELGRPIPLPTRLAPSPAADIAAFDSNPGFARALAFYALGMRFEGNREWNFQMRDLTDPQLRAAAHWAVANRLLDRGINTDERIVADADFNLRFPTPFREQLLPITRQQDLDIAWVYGLIRQESRFIMDARSHVGASGLMQLMPATARWVARKLGRKGFRQSDLNDTQTNLEFGSFYLKQALDDLDGSAVLASAGYNAGPNRAHRWRGSLSGPLEGAIFAEIIPFTETRGYVKNVLSNATDYAALFTGSAQSLKARLGTIEPKKDKPTPLP